VYRIRVSLDYKWKWSIIPQYLFRWNEETSRYVPNLLVLGLLTTLRLSIWSSVLALLIGTVLGIVRLGKGLFARVVGRSYVELIRNTPPLVLVFIFYFFIGNQIMAALGVERFVSSAGPGMKAVIGVLFSPPARFPEFLSAVLTLALYEGAYITEIVRAGIQSVDKGQWEAAYSLGLSSRHQYRFIILPQALRTILPALAGQFISAIKDSAIVAVISIQELTFQGLELMSSTYRAFEIWITITVLYFVLTGTCSFAARRLEAYMHRGRR
jgi:polar amino acid transport system permease protein